MNERVKELRKYLGLTQDKFGEKLGIKKSAVSKIEKSENGVTDQMFKSICREFNVNEEWLRDGVGEMFVKRDKLQIISEFADDIFKHHESFKAILFETLASLDEKDWITLEHIFDRIASSKDF